MTGFTVSEPHPTVVKGTYIHSGRGGAGNYFRAPETTPSVGVPMHVTTSSSTTSTSSRRFFSGRGGAGNAHEATEAPLMSFDEEYTRAKNRDEHGVGHVGRGGAGNVFSTSKSSAGSAPSSRRSSGESENGSRSSFWARISSHTVSH